jgi:hypothetical protein
VPRRRADAWYKFQGNPETTYNNSIFSDAIFSHWPLWKEGLHCTEAGQFFTVVPGNRVVPVPKNAKIDRLIAIEPDLNLFVQKGIGKMIRRRLKRVGVDLDDQTINQRLALQGSLTGLLATIDFSMASDTICYWIVLLLLPPEWLQAMDMARSPKGVFASDKTEVLYRKFSSMGNGFTFELESLIFWALSEAVQSLSRKGGRFTSVYGDDLIVPTDQAPLVLEAFEFFGFKPNLGKSFQEGPFRESCGKHYFNGTDVSPFYIREDVNTNRDILLLANNLVRWSRRSHTRDARVKPVYDWLTSQLPVKLQRLRIPEGYGDGGLVGSFDEILPQRAPNGVEGWIVKSVVSKQKKKSVQGHASLLKSLWTISNGPLSDSFVERKILSWGETHGSVLAQRDNRGYIYADLGLVGGYIPRGETYHIKNVLVSRVPEIGPWF